MPTLTVRKVTPEIHDHLRRQAARRGHSMEAEVRDILARNLRQNQTSPGTVARRIHKRFVAIGGADDLHLPDRAPLAVPPVFEK